MPKVNFYLLEEQGEEAFYLFACRLLEKAYIRKHRVYVHCADKNAALRLDELLWTFKDNSFIPHNLEGETLTPPPAIQIGYATEPKFYNDILLNLSNEIPSFYSRFKRVFEIVKNDEEAKNSSRNRYRQYRQANCELTMHQL
ncbi:MAG: DNA polymerase III subunit chi [Proteobacteria bacterium]|nr:DNA polymerase III subunit chi [Pseudomonadota bacterium]